MRKKVIKVRLDPNSIADAITELQMYKEELERRVELLVKTLTDRGAEIARAKVVDMDAVYSGDLLGSINSYLSATGAIPVGFIRVNADYGMFVEFGTGIVGAENPNHPAHSAFDWEHDIHGHGYSGWWYPGDDGQAHWTKGQPSRPFMYETARQLEAEFPKIVQEVFGCSTKSF